MFGYDFVSGLEIPAILYKLFDWMKDNSLVLKQKHQISCQAHALLYCINVFKFLCRTVQSDNIIAS